MYMKKSQVLSYLWYNNSIFLLLPLYLLLCLPLLPSVFNERRATFKLCNGSYVHGV